MTNDGLIGVAAYHNGEEGGLADAGKRAEVPQHA
jgi:hypothetical protein